MKCRICECEITKGMLKCVSCGAINIPNFYSTETKKQVDNDTVLISDIADEEIERLDVKYMNRIFGGEILNLKEMEESEEVIEELNGPGLVKESVILLGGNPGAGKSTLELQLSDLMCEVVKEGEVLIICAEESYRQIKPRATRLGIKHSNRIRLVKAMGGGVDIGEKIMQFKPRMCIIDSLKGLVGNDDAGAIYICETAKKFAEQLRCPFIIIQHFTKGEELAGANTLQHAVDQVLLFRPIDEDPNIRELEVNPKNRFGRAYIKMHFEMTAKGLIPLPNTFDPADLDDEE